LSFAYVVGAIYEGAGDLFKLRFDVWSYIPFFPLIRELIVLTSDFSFLSFDIPTPLRV
jgi:hypothetical protein